MQLISKNLVNLNQVLCDFVNHKETTYFDKLVVVFTFLNQTDQLKDFIDFIIKEDYCHEQDGSISKIRRTSS
jgi:hypothetical protein